MKNVAIAAWVILASSVMAQTDVRTVNSIQVDLGPLHQWLKDKKGERPLKHWKQITITQRIDKLMPWDDCMATGEDVPGEILIRLPASAKAYVLSMKQQMDEIETIGAQLKQAQSDLARRDAVAPTYAAGDPAFVAAAANQRNKVNLDAISLEDRKKELFELMDKHKAALEKWDQYMSFFAMFTGKTYNDLQVWDCGKK